MLATKHRVFSANKSTIRESNQSRLGFGDSTASIPEAHCVLTFSKRFKMAKIKMGLGKASI